MWFVNDKHCVILVIVTPKYEPELIKWVENKKRKLHTCKQASSQSGKQRPKPGKYVIHLKVFPSICLQQKGKRRKFLLNMVNWIWFMFHQLNWSIQ